MERSQRLLAVIEIQWYVRILHLSLAYTIQHIDIFHNPIFVRFVLCVQNLFDFGDQDGSQTGAKFQHPLGLAFDASTKFLYVADTYNNKIRAIKTSTGEVTTCHFKDEHGNDIVFNEPSALCMSPCNQYLLVCNTNNHTIEVIRLAISTAYTLKLKPKLDPSQWPLEKTLTAPEILIHEHGAKISLELNLVAGINSKFIAQAPQAWKVKKLSNQSWITLETSGSFEKIADVDDANRIVKLSKTIEVTASASSTDDVNNTVEISYNLNLCSESQGFCFPKHFYMIIPVKYSPDGPADVHHKADMYVDLAGMKWLSEKISK